MKPPRWDVRGILVLVFTLVLMRCGARSDMLPLKPISSRQLVLLTRDGYMNTTTMRARLGHALRVLQRPAEFDVVDLDTLPATDVRRGYPTPTLLYADRDVFGMDVPKPPLPTPT
jgi:hypothetical protein